jgi:hypothetical protein
MPGGPSGGGAGFSLSGLGSAWGLGSGSASNIAIAPSFFDELAFRTNFGGAAPLRPASMIPGFESEASYSEGWNAGTNPLPGVPGGPGIPGDPGPPGLALSSFFVNVKDFDGSILLMFSTGGLWIIVSISRGGGAKGGGFNFMIGAPLFTGGRGGGPAGFLISPIPITF